MNLSHCHPSVSKVETNPPSVFAANGLTLSVLKFLQSLLNTWILGMTGPSKIGKREKRLFIEWKRSWTDVGINSQHLRRCWVGGKQMAAA